MEEQNSMAQAVTVENGSPYLAKPHESVFQKLSMIVFPCFIFAIYVFILVYFFVLFRRLVRASEKIAAKLEGGITLKQENPEL